MGSREASTSRRKGHWANSPVRPSPRRIADGPSGSALCWCRGLTDDEEDVAQIAKFAADLGNVKRVEVLPFHQMGRYKWKALGLNYALDDIPVLRLSELVEKTCEIFRGRRTQQRLDKLNE